MSNHEDVTDEAVALSDESAELITKLTTERDNMRRIVENILSTVNAGFQDPRSTLLAIRCHLRDGGFEVK